MYLAPGGGLDQRINNNNNNSEGPAICLTLFRDMLKSSGLLYPFVKLQISCVLLSSEGLNTQFSYVTAVCLLSCIPLWDTQTTEFLLLTDPLQALDIQPSQVSMLASEPCSSGRFSFCSNAA